jgi:hypothetical protein
MFFPNTLRSYTLDSQTKPPNPISNKCNFNGTNQEKKSSGIKIKKKNKGPK